MARLRGTVRWGRIAAVVAVVPALVLPAVVIFGRSEDPKPPPRVTSAADSGVAFVAARRQNEPVMVASLTTPTRKVSAKPDGSLVAELTTRPARVRRAGAWTELDPTLAARPDGTVRPKVAAAELAFSGGQAGKPAVRFGAPGRSFALTWPAKLPKPVLKGADATYPDVLPGVDLVFKAQADGFAQHLVVRTAEAARNPALAKVRFKLTTDGLKLTATKSGAVEARDAAGKVIFTAPPSEMWDATGKRARVGVAVDATALTLSPDRALLADKAAKFPIVIDPDWATFNQGGWTKVFSGKPDSGHWWGGNDDDSWAKVGRCDWAGCNGIGVARSYWMFETGFLNGKRIMSAALNATIVYGPQCNTRNHELWATGGINAGTTWNNAPQGWHVGTAGAGAHYTGCEGYKSIGFNVNGALNTTGWSTFFIKAADENDKFAWRKYDGGATKITVNYNTRPNPPYELNTDPRLAAPCKWCDGKQYFGDDSIRLQGKLSDPDNDQLTAQWDVYGGPSKEHKEGPTLGSGNIFSTNIDLRGRDKQTVSWTLWGGDGADGGDWKNGPGPFVVDLVGVDKAPGVVGGLYQEDNRWHGGVGVPGTFTFDASGVADIDHYLYGWNDPPSTKVDADALGGKATVSIAPPGDGPRDLYVQSVDRAGHRSPTKKLHLYVRAGNGPLAQWSFEGNAKDTAFLGDRDGTLSGNASYVQGAVGTAISLDGTTGYVTAPNTVRTDASLSVSVWAKVTNGDHAQAIVSQDGATYAGLNLWYRPENGGRWVFGMVNPATTDKWTEMASSSAPAQLGTWTQLTAVYDAPAKQLRLYVNGVLSVSLNRPSAPVNTTGPVRIGRTMWDSNPAVDYFGGTIDEVGLYDRILTETEIRAAVGRDNVQLAHWKFDETSGTTAGNAVPGGAMGVLQGQAKFSPTGAVNGGLQLDNPNDYVSAGAPVVRTDQSFSVSAWVKQDQALPSGNPDAAVSQDGAVISGFYLGYRQNAGSGGKWEFYLPTADAIDRPTDEGVWSSTAAELGTWTHLTGVYDAPAKQIRLYVNGVLAGSGPRLKGFNATGPLLIGRGKWNGNVGHQWKGGIDEVRAFSRTVSEAEIRGILSQDNVTGGQWKLDGNAQDSSPRALHGTPINAPEYTAGQASLPDPSDLAVRLNGTTTWVSAPHAVDTDRSFSVAAWARLDKLGGLPAVLSEDGSRTSAFKIRARPDGNWGFVMFDADTEDDGTKRAEAVGGTVQVGQWTHLVAVYDQGAKQLLLYVNGVKAGSVAHEHNWNASGGLQIGRAKWAGGPVEYFPGAVDDVTAYGRALFASEIQTMAGRDLSLIHNYPLDESSGSNAADAVGSRNAALTGGAKFGPGRAGNALDLDGANDAATTAGVDLRTDQAFTVSAWVRLPEKLECETVCRRDAVTVDGSQSSKFRLGHVIDDDQHPDGAWTFEMPESDAKGARITKAAVATLPSEVERWVHLAGAYDPTSKKIWLYVNGTRVGDGTLDNAWPATGPLAIGRGKVDGAAAAFWRGGVDDVRLYTGQLDKDRILALYRSYPAEAGSATLPTANAARWRFDENTGTTAADSSGRGLTATLKGGAGWIGGRSAYSSWFDGTSGYAETAAPVLDTTKSFSAAAWVYLTSADTQNRAVLGQDGNRLSSFLLQYNGASKTWAVVVPTADKDNPGAAVTILNSAEPAAAGEWTHLAMSYDANLRQVRLYVNGLLSGAQVGVTVLPSSGPMSIGRARWNGANASFFPRGIDDVRVYSRAISPGEVRKVHDDIEVADIGIYRFDEGNAKDSSWRKLEATPSGGVTYGPGVSGKALQLDGTTGSLTVPWSHAMRDSITVSGWARLGRNDRVATVASQDGDHNSGFVLQYRPNLKRWVFGSANADSDGAPLVAASSLVAPKLNQWTHLTGIYDYAGRQLRLYVDGELAGTKDNVTMWRATGKMVLGRELINGQPAGFFSGGIDDVRLSDGVATDEQIAVRAGWGTPPAGQLGRFVNAAGDRYTGRTNEVRPGYHFEATLGVPAAPGQRTRPLYACSTSTDAFTSQDADCEGSTKLGEIGLVYTEQPTNVPTIPIYRCKTESDHFESRQANCDGKTVEGLLGYTLAYGNFARYSLDGFDHISSTDGSPAGYRAEGTQGLLGLTHQAGGQPLLSCQDGPDLFVSTNVACDGKTVLGTLGDLWPQPPADQVSHPIYQCRIGAVDRFVSLSANCEGMPVERLLGYALTGVPAVTPEFPEELPS